jgi:predicted amidohydrolase YtcJ
MVMLDRDPWETDPDQIGGIGVKMTIVSGNIVYDAAAA